MAGNFTQEEFWGILSDPEEKHYLEKREVNKNSTELVTVAPVKLNMLTVLICQTDLTEVLFLRSTTHILAGFIARFLPDLLCQHHVKL